jgi:hypothetical protein
VGSHGLGKSNFAETLKPANKAVVGVGKRLPWDLNFNRAPAVRTVRAKPLADQ